MCEIETCSDSGRYPRFASSTNNIYTLPNASEKSNMSNSGRSTTLSVLAMDVIRFKIELRALKVQAKHVSRENAELELKCDDHAPIGEIKEGENVGEKSVKLRSE